MNQENISQAAQIVINDGRFLYPVLRSDVESAGLSMSQVAELDTDGYGIWCALCPMPDDSGCIGTQQCIDYCAKLIGAGAEEWTIG